MRGVFGVLAACSVCLWVSGCKSREPDKARVAAAPVLDKPAVLAELPAGRPGEAGYELIFSERGGGVAWVAEEGGKYRVFHNGRAGAPYAGVGPVVLSRDGRRIAYGAIVDGKWRMVVDGKEGASFTGVDSAVFSPDGSHIAYQANDGRAWHLVVDDTVGAAGSKRYEALEFNADSSRIAFLEDVDDEGWGTLAVSDVALRKRIVVDARASNVRFNEERSRVAAIASTGGRQRVVSVALDRPEQVQRGPLHDGAFAVTFGSDGVSLAYVAVRGVKHYLVLEGREVPLPEGDELITRPVFRSAKGNLGVLVASDGAVLVRQFFSEADVREGPYEAAEGLVYSSDGRSHAYAAQKGERSFIVVDGKEGPVFDRVVSPVYSPDGKFLVYRARKDGKRFVVIADAQGKTIRQLPPYEQVFPVRFTADGKSIAYGVKDGRQVAWKVEPL